MPVSVNQNVLLPKNERLSTKCGNVIEITIISENYHIENAADPETGVRVPMPCTIKNHYITFDSPQTINSLLLTEETFPRTVN